MEELKGDHFTYIRIARRIMADHMLNTVKRRLSRKSARTCAKGIQS